MAKTILHLANGEKVTVNQAIGEFEEQALNAEGAFNFGTIYVNEDNAKKRAVLTQHIVSFEEE